MRHSFIKMLPNSMTTDRKHLQKRAEYIYSKFFAHWRIHAEEDWREYLVLSIQLQFLRLFFLSEWEDSEVFRLLSCGRFIAVLIFKILKDVLLILYSKQYVILLWRIIVKAIILLVMEHLKHSYQSWQLQQKKNFRWQGEYFMTV